MSRDVGSSTVFSNQHLYYTQLNFINKTAKSALIGTLVRRAIAVLHKAFSELGEADVLKAIIRGAGTNTANSASIAIGVRRAITVFHKDFEERENNTIGFFKEIKQNYFLNPDKFARKSIEIGYSLLVLKLKEYPAQWECWGYRHKWFKRDKIISYCKSTKVPMRFNDKRYSLFFS